MTTKLRCPVCGDYGVLMKKTTITKIAGRSYRYEKWYVYHNRSKGTKQRWCYLSKKYLELPEITETIQKEQATQNTTQIATQNISKSEKPKFSIPNQTEHDSIWAGSSAWHERLTCTQEDAGSNPARSTIRAH